MPLALPSNSEIKMSLYVLIKIHTQSLNQLLLLHCCMGLTEFTCECSIIS